ncbi:hypothetical protein HMPREF0372_03974 [Flavonifractor plautii ATCC 29863]|uniref:Uncharacterized protein n=1 Tax=Flavonifractor plautii ATCC 29863 TaxID=411475 RepID=G9YWQ8_FLAPL|nr:hypothetical protein HMPREF0372_03974 [Flavonifractor plautii ATCC 29863]
MISFPIPKGIGTPERACRGYPYHTTGNGKSRRCFQKFDCPFRR